MSHAGWREQRSKKQMAPNPDTSEMVAEARHAFYGLPSLPLHKYLGIVFERMPSGTPSLSLPASPEIVGSDGQHSLPALFTLAEVAAGVEACDAIWPHAAERGMIPVGLTVSARFSPGGPARGTIRAVTSLLSDLDQIFGGEKAPRKVTVEVGADLESEDGTPVGEYRGGLYARFMEHSRAQALAASVSEIAGLSPGAADLMSP